ncbi:DUF6382 domain-containing protein, partial [Ruminococcaceae bacterium OttesenSCG-928-L11]|nr:DUF6382 domain-containing protein [Ruminococcaceae bacterium OttesenSCG-928-L11]
MTTTRFQIEERGGLAGITLVVRIPEGDLDYKALRTIQGETPSFIIPFQSRQVDGDVELTYQLGSLNKLVYFCGSKPRDLYIDLWLSLINPLTRCDDWFMSHSSFLLDLDYIYYDNNAPRDAVKYLYVPSVRPCTDYAGLKQFVEALSQKI